MSDPLIKVVIDRMADEHFTYMDKERGPAGKGYKNTQIELLKAVKAVGNTGDIQRILDTEKAMLMNELRLYGNSTGMRASLEAGLLDFNQADRHLEIVQDKNEYAKVDKLFQRPKNRRGGLPYDEARQAFAAHNARLLNQDRSRLSQTEKQTLSARRSNLRVAEKAYIGLQKQALGMDPDKPKARTRER